MTSVASRHRDGLRSMFIAGGSHMEPATSGGKTSLPDEGLTANIGERSCRWACRFQGLRVPLLCAAVAILKSEAGLRALSAGAV